MVTYTDARGSSVTSVPANTPVAPGDALVQDPYGNYFLTSQANAAGMTTWLASRAAGNTSAPCPAAQSTVSPMQPGAQVLPGNVVVTDRYGNQYQTEPGMAAGLQRVVDSREAPLKPGYSWQYAGGVRMQVANSTLEAANNPSSPNFHYARQNLWDLFGSYGLSRRSGDANGADNDTGNKQDRITGLWSRNPTNPMTLREQAEMAARDRPGYYGLPGEGLDPARTVGDRKTALFAESLYFLSKYGGVGSFDSREKANASALEIYRQYSYGGGTATPGVSPTKAAQYYSGELQKTVSRPVEKASEYHFLGQAAGVPVPANPWEYQSDLAVEFLKGSSERFSPVSGQMAASLPGMGLQQWSWNVALNTDRPEKYQKPGNVSFMPGVMALGAAEGQYGVYGSLFGGPDYRGTPSSDGIRKQADFIYTPEARSRVQEAISRAASQRKPEPTSRDLPYLTITNAIGMGSGTGPRLRGSKVVATEMVVAPIGSPVQKETPSFFGDVSGWFRDAPLLGSVFALGSSIPKNRTDQIAGFLRTAPVFESVYRGGSAFGLKSEYERRSTAAMKELGPVLSDYDSRIGQYNEDVKAYSGRLAAYNKNKTEAGYYSLLAEEQGLASRKKALDEMKGSIDARIQPVTDLEKRYKVAAAGMTGNVNQESLWTFGLGSWVGGVGKGYQGVVEKPIGDVTKGWGAFGQFIGGAVSAPRAFAEIGQMSLIGGETILRSAANAPGLAAAGTAMQIQGLKQQGEENPAGLAGTIAGMFVIGAAAGAVTTRAIGVARTTGKNYVPIEDIGYDAKFGYPVKPGSATSRDLIRSFMEGRLIPAPKKMSANDVFGNPVKPPYLHGENGVPVARLPNAKPGDLTLWTAHETPSLAGRANVGDVYTMTGSGSSELEAVSAAPVLEGYFHKVGGQIPKFIGVQSPFKTPTAYSTVVDTLETIPSRIRAALPRNAGGKITDFTAVNQYMKARLARNPNTGTGFVPMFKAEYEANLVTGSVFEVTGRNYYTKIGGVGKNHLFGVRVPIIEQKMIGFEASDAVTKVAARNVGSSYKKGPVINLSYGVPAGIGTALATSRLSTGRSFAGSNRTNPDYIGHSKSGDRRSGASAPRTTHFSSGYMTEPVYRTSDLTSVAGSSVLSGIKSFISPRSMTSKVSAPSSPRSPYSPGRSVYSPATSIRTPRTPGYGYTRTPPRRTPGSPTPKTPTPGTPIIPFPGLLPGLGGGGPAELRRMRRRWFEQVFRPMFGRLRAQMFAESKKAMAKKKKRKRR